MSSKISCGGANLDENNIPCRQNIREMLDTYIYTPKLQTILRLGDLIL